jgi:hypothetical protein
VPRSAARHQPRSARDLLRGLDVDDRDAALFHSRAAALGDGKLGVDLIEVLLHDEIDPHAGCAFLTRLGEEDDVLVERNVEPLRKEHRYEIGGELVLVVLSAAPQM